MSDLDDDLISRLDANLISLDSSVAEINAWFEQDGPDADTLEIRRQLEALSETTDAIAALFAELVAEKADI